MLDSCGDGRDNGEVEEGMRHFVPPFSFDSSLSHPYSCAILCRSVRRGEELEVWLRVAGVGWSFSCVINMSNAQEGERPKVQSHGQGRGQFMMVWASGIASVHYIQTIVMLFTSFQQIRVFIFYRLKCLSPSIYIYPGLRQTLTHLDRRIAAGDESRAPFSCIAVARQQH
jgi:hypothetical protein